MKTTIIFNKFKVNNAQKEAEIDADTFFSVPIRVVNKVVCVNNIPLTVDGKEITTVLTENGEVG